MTLLSIFGGGLWAIPCITLLGAAIFGVIAFKAHNSNSTKQNKDGSTSDNTGNVPYWQIGQFWFSVVLALATVVICFLMWLDK